MVPERHGWSPEEQPSQELRALAWKGLAQAGAGAQWFFWELAEAGVEGGGSEKRTAPGAWVRDAGEVKATGDHAGDLAV